LPGANIIAFTEMDFANPRRDLGADIDPAQSDKMAVAFQADGQIDRACKGC